MPRFQGKILIGTKDNDVIEVGEKNGQLSVLVAGHGEGEVWGLDRHPSAPRFITASYDGTVRIWDIANKVGLVKTCPWNIQRILQVKKTENVL